MPKFQQTIERTVLDSETGEIINYDQNKIFTERIDDDNFYMTFIDYVSPLFGLKPESAKNLLVWMCQHAEFNTGKVSLTTADRKQITKTLGLANNSITNYLKTLKNLKLITGNSGLYIINPQIFWKGDLKTRRALLKDAELQITFGIKPKQEITKTDLTLKEIQK